MVNISIEPVHQQLRDALDEITALPPEQVPQHPVLVARLRSTQPHGIEVANDPEVAHVPLERFTCFMHAFGLADSEAVIRIARALRDAYPSREFVTFLVTHHLLELSHDEVRDGDVVVYSDAEKITHTGKMRAGRVVSKWGIGHLWEHGIFEVPARYGHQVKFYRSIESPVAEQAFVVYAKQREGAELIDQLLAE